MRVLRSTLFSAYMIVSTIFTGILAVLLIPFPYKYRYACINVYANSVIKVLSLLCGIVYQVEGREHIQHPAIIFCKHQSTFRKFNLGFFVSRRFVYRNPDRKNH